MNVTLTVYAYAPKAYSQKFANYEIVQFTRLIFIDFFFYLFLFSTCLPGSLKDNVIFVPSGFFL